MVNEYSPFDSGESDPPQRRHFFRIFTVHGRGTTRHEPEGGPVRYKMEIVHADTGRNFQIAARYTNFRELKDLLKSEDNNFCVKSQFPSRTFFRCRGRATSVVKKREQLFRAWLEDVLGRYGLNKTVSEFVGRVGSTRSNSFPAYDALDHDV
eukprot:c15175_g1_i3.p1 GENE.c15175_g1_i3~~c15175_g1_i3.p1  ORF type:complete len:168 (+),score=16.19 c15175_g1_i3:51-506(+)